MINKKKTRETKEFGDFQTPPELALAATQILCRLGIQPHSILEPTCGRGAFIAAASKSFPDAKLILGVDINKDHLNAAAAIKIQGDSHIKLHQADFFKLDWSKIIGESKAPLLILGNPPWVTSASLASVESNNLPEKSNFHGRQGIEAITGKSNFDISEWMLLRYLEWLDGSRGTIAVLCKTTVARKVLLDAWKKKLPVHSAYIYKIDAFTHFGAAVDACFFILQVQPKGSTLKCDIFSNLYAETPSHTIGYLNGYIISDVIAFNRYRGLLGPESHYVWRSGIKHDCSKVMELKTTSKGYENGLSETVNIEDNILFPMLKSSDIGNGRVHCRSAMLVTQQFVGEDTDYIRTKAPKAWKYLRDHALLLDNRKSVIYKKKPPFSIFGVGSYSFAPWKVAISGFYKKLKFVVVGPVNGRPVVFDDTVYFLPCWTIEEAYFIETLLLSEPAQNFFLSMIHWDEKRPITVDILKRLSIYKLATMLDRENEYAFFATSTESSCFALPHSHKIIEHELNSQV
ncbi:MAG: SAM-dependent methyltransferase [Alphaproteobacteria bacterium]|jgi:hypothetical protein|nr:SAM-dependent methyltransferase [Alphaproteobacteria bacterium]